MYSVESASISGFPWACMKEMHARTHAHTISSTIIIALLNNSQIKFYKFLSHILFPHTGIENSLLATNDKNVNCFIIHKKIVLCLLYLHKHEPPKNKLFPA